MISLRLLQVIVLIKIILSDLRIILSIFLFTLALSINAQQFYSENLTSADGLPNDAIRSIYEDSRGFIWIGTDAGVSRWDGNEFKIYNTLDGLIGNKVWWIDEDNGGNLWFACFGAGISKFDGKKFINYTDKDGLPDNSVRIIKYSSHHNCIAIGTNKAISVLKDSLFYNFSFKNKSLKKDVIITGILDNDSCIEFYDFTNQHSRVFFIDGKPHIKTTNFKLFNKYGISSVFEDKNGDNYFGWSRSGVIKKNESGLLEIPNIGQVFGFAEDYARRIWIASWNGGGISPPGGLFVFDNDKIKSLNSAYGINSIRGWSMHFSKNHNLIFYGTLDNGLYKIPPPWFEYYSAEYFKESDLAIIDMETDANNNIWFITDSLLVKWDGGKYEKLNFDVFHQLRNDYEKYGTTHSNFKNRLSANNEPTYKNGKKFVSVEKDRHGNIWLSVATLGLFSFPTNSLSKIEFHAIKTMSDFIFDEADTLFQSNVWLNYLIKHEDFKQSDKTIFYQDSSAPMFAKKLANYKNEIWAFSRISGVFFEKDGNLRTLTKEDASISKIVNDICFDSEGFAYLAGVDGKIDILEPISRKKVFEIYNNKNHKPFYWLKISNDRLFTGNSNELRIYELNDIKKGNNNYQLYQQSEGYCLKSIKNSIVDKDGNIWLATKNSLVKVVTNLMYDNNFAPLTTIIKKVEILNKNSNWSDIAPTDKWSGLPTERVELNFIQNHISIYYHTLNYNNSTTDSYYYKLEVADKEWIGPIKKDYVVYPNLRPGNYTFKVKSRNDLSGLYSNIAEFKFKILPPWYLQIWFIILLSVLLITILTVFYKIRIHIITKREIKKTAIVKRISELEMKALQSQMNPHFLFNSLNSIQDFILDNDVDNALLYLNSFSRVIRMTLDFADKKFISLTDELTYLEHYVSLENMRFDNLFTYNLAIDDDIDQDSTLIPPMLLQPIIENSIKHGVSLLTKKGSIKLAVKKVNEYTFKCIIEDNGVGRIKSNEIESRKDITNNSKALKITQERLNILNDKKSSKFKIDIIDLYSINNEACGTRVEITLAFILK